MKAALLAVAAFVFALGGIPPAAPEVDTIDLVIQQAFAADAEGFHVSPVPRCYSACVNCQVTDACFDSLCLGPDPDCIHLYPQIWCCQVIQYDWCDCL